MDKNKATQILNELEALRDRGLIIWSPNDLVEDFFLRNLNIFTSTFSFATTEVVEEATSPREIYMAYLRSRNTPTRFLIEQYLTMIHIAVMSPELRFKNVYMYELSGKFNVHKLDLKLQAICVERGLTDLRKQLSGKLETNRKGYRLLLELDGKLSDAMPDEIDGFFEGTGLMRDIPQRFGVTPYSHGKINFMYEINNNPLVLGVSKEFLLVHYPLLSMDIHPTHNSIVDFEQFLDKTEADKKNTALGRNGAMASQLCVVGSDMVRVLHDLIIASESE